MLQITALRFALGLLLLTTPTLAQTVPIIVTNVPPNGATGVPPADPVIVTFSVPMNTAVTTVQFFNSSVPPPNGLSVIRSWNAEGTRVTNTPNPPFPEGKSITWFATGIDRLGHPLGPPLTGAFLTASGGGPIPELISVVPTNQSVQVPTNTPVVFTFSVAMNTNRTSARFHDVQDPSQSIAVVPTWNDTHTVLTCSPTPAFPGGRVMIWNLQGEGDLGGAFPGAGGAFTTAGGEMLNGAWTTVLSRGESGRQVAAAAPPASAWEFLALATPTDDPEVRVVPPGGITNLLTAWPGGDGLRSLTRSSDPTAFASSHPPGSYRLEVGSSNGVSTATVALTDGARPGMPRLVPWTDPPRAVVGQPWVVSWSLEGGTEPTDHVQFQIVRGGRILFASPLPDAPGALTGASNLLVVPAAVFTEPGTAEVSLTAIRYTAIETNAIPGLTLRAGRHQTTQFPLRVIDGTTPPPTLTFTRFPGIPVGESVRYPLRFTNGVAPVRFERLSGTLPPGLSLETDGSLIGLASESGVYAITVQLTDLLGRTTTESVQLTTSPMPAFPAPRLEHIQYDGGRSVRFEIVGGAGADCRLERSRTLASWDTLLRTNPPTGRVAIEVPVGGDTEFFRVLGPEARPPANPLAVTPVPRTGDAVSGSIGLFGGTLSFTNAAGWVYSLEIPPGALDSTEELTLTDLARVDGLPLSGGLRAALDLQPAGRVLRAPATLTITAPDGLDPARDVAFHSLTDGLEFALIPFRFSDRAASLELLYLSVVGLGRGTLSDIQAQLGRPPMDPILAVNQEAAAIQLACALGNCESVTFSTTGPATSGQPRRERHDFGDDREAWIARYVATAKQTVLPLLKAAADSEDDAALDNALWTWSRWLKELQLLGLADDTMGQDQEGELAACLQSAAGLAARGIWNGLTRSCQGCLDHDLARIGRMESLTRTAGVMGWDFQSYYFECAQRCLNFEIQIESLMIYSGTAGTSLTDTKTKIEVKPFDNDWTSILVAGGYEGEATWEVKNVQDWDSKCRVTNAPKNGTASVPLMRLRLFQQRCDYIPGQGLVLRNTFYPDLRIYLVANLDKMPKEGRVSRCPKEDPRDVPDVFSPAFLAMHANTTETPEAIGEKCVRLEGFEQVSSGDVVFRKQYVETQVVKDGYVEERTTVELHHKPN